MGEYYEGWDTAAANNNDDPTLDGGGGGSGGGSGGAGGTSGLKNSGASTMALNSKLPSSSNLGQQIRRRSSFVSMFTSLGMSPGAVNSGNNATAAVSSNVSYSAWGDSGAGGASGTAGGGGGVGGGGPNGTGMGGDEGGGGTTGANQSNLDENEMNVFLPPRFRRGSSATFIAPGGAGSTSLAMRRGSTNSIAEGPSSSSMRDRVGSVGGSMAAHNSIGRYPRWMLHDPSAIVMKDGQPIPLGMLVHHHTLLSPSQSSHPSTPYFVTPTWRLKERMKTVGVCLILALNIGTDPPDINKPNPCAKLQCWLDPTSISRAKAKERIGERLEQQYARWQQRSKLKYRRALDPTVDIVQELCFRMRETAKGERVLLHYNGHGVPRPTPNGEIWLFDKHHTNYIPFSVTDLRKWIGKPSVVVLDCSGAGVLMPFFTSALNANGENNGVGDGGNGWNIGSEALPAGGAPSLPTNSSDPNDPIRGECGYVFCDLVFFKCCSKATQVQ